MVFLGEAIEAFLQYADGIKNLSPHSLKAYRNDLSFFLSSFPEKEKKILFEIDLIDMRSCVGLLSKQKKTATTINRFICTIRSFFLYLYRMNILPNNIALDLKTVKIPKKLPRYMSDSEVDALRRQPEKKELLWTERDRAIFECLYSSGARVSELSNLNLRDLAANLSSAIVTGKGSKDRKVFFSQDAVEALKVYLVQRAEIIQKNKAKIEALFINQRGGRLTARGIFYVVNRYSSVEGTNKPVSPHAFRHTFATTMLKNGANIRVVQELLGHENISTTQKYTHITKEQLIQTYNASHPHGGKNEL